MGPQDGILILLSKDRRRSEARRPLLPATHWMAEEKEE